MGFNGGVTIDLTSINDDIKNLNIKNAQTAMNIIKLQANGSVPDLDYTGLFVDTMSDSDGYNNSVNTGNTTANYDSTNKKYKRIPAITGSQENMTATGTAVNSTTLTTNFIAEANGIITEVQVGLNTSSKTSTATIKNSSGSTIATKTIVGTEYPTQFLFTPSDYSEIIQNGAQFSVTITSTQNAIKTLASQNIDLVKFKTNGVQTYMTYLSGNNYIGFTEIDNPIQKIRINFPTITGTITHIMLVTNKPDSEIGTSITCDISDGTNTISGIAEYTKVATSALSVNPTYMDIYLNPKITNPTMGYPSLQDYAIVIWTV